jgi:hypothetical protein
VLSLILTVVVVWLVLMGLLAAWTLWFQGYIYSEPVGQIYWRAPAAGTALTVFLLFWIFLDYRAPGRYRGLNEFNYYEEVEYEELRILTNDNKEEVYKRGKNAQGRWEYRRGDRTLPSRPQRIVAVLGDQTYTFVPDRDAQGHFKPAPDGSLYYRDERGLEMKEGNPGRVRIRHTSWLVINLLLNFGHLAVWFVVLWLLLRFQWSHALGLALVFWVVTMLFVLPPVLTQAETTAKERTAQKAAGT